MQGFFIVPASSGTFSLDNDDRTHLGANNFYKSSEDYTLENGIILQASNGNYNDELFVLLNKNALQGFDFTHDAWKMESSTPGLSQLWSACPDGDLSIDVRPYQEEIQLGFSNDIAGNYTIAIKDIADISKAIIEDTKTGSYHNLKSGEFNFYWEPTDNTNRFTLHLSAVGINEGSLSDDNTIIYSSGKTVYIDSEANKEAQVMITDIRGRILHKQIITTKGLISIPTNLQTGIYVVSVRSENSLSTKKVIIR